MMRSRGIVRDIVYGRRGKDICCAAADAVDDDDDARCQRGEGHP